MKNNYLMRMVFTLLLCGCFSMSYGADWYISATGDDILGDGSMSTPWKSFSKAQTAAASGDIIHVSGMIDMWSDADNTVFTLVTAPDVNSTTNKTGIIITKDLTIQGTNSATDGFTGINGTNSTRIFQILSNVTVTMNNLKLANGKIISSLLSADTNYTNVLGGALLIKGGTITTNNVVFESNSSNLRGGAVSITPASVVTVAFNNTIFLSNASTTEGGAFNYTDTATSIASKVTFTNCALISNSCGGSTLGGAAYINSLNASLSLISFINTTIAKNTAGGVSGGALLVANLTASSEIKLINCTITENKVSGTSGNAGAGIRLLTAVAGKTYIYNSIIENNLPITAPTALGSYGDITIQGDSMAKLVMSNSIVGKYGGSGTAITNFNTAFSGTNLVSYVTYSSGLTNFKAKFGTFNITSNYYPLLTGSSALNYGLNTYLTDLVPSVTTDQIGNPRDQAPLCDAGSIQEIRIVATPPPTLTADATNNTVDNVIDITYPSTPTWQSAITAVQVGGTNLTATTDYVLSDGNIQLKPAGLNALLTTSGTKSITVTATGYNDAIVSQDINAGIPTKLTMRRQPTAPTNNGARLAVQPQVNVQDQYSNTIFVTDKVTGLPTAGNWTIGGTNVKGLEAAGYVNFSSMTATSAIAVTGATITFTLGSLTPVVSNAFDIPSPVIKTWTGTTDTNFNTATNWSDAAAPTSASWILIPSAGVTNFPVISSSTTVVSITIETGASLTVNSGSYLTVSDVLVNNGTLTIENNANLIQSNDVENTGSGSTIVKRNSNDLKRLDYTLWSSPVSGVQTLADFSPLTSQSPNRFYTYNPTANQFAAAAFASPFSEGAGYLIRMPNEGTANYNTGAETLVYTGQFIGTPNNGNVSVNTSTSGAYYSVGNPYPSTIDAQEFLDANTTDGTLYFWRKTNGTDNIVSGSSTGTAYATWTTLGGTKSSGTVAPNDILPNGTIQVGQGFIVKSNAASLNFTNAMRNGTVSTQIFKTKQLAEKSRIWINLTNATGVFSQVLIGYLDGATLGVDNGIDGKYINDSKVALTSSINNEEYTIQGRPAFDATDVVALNFKTDVAGDYSIAIDQVDGLFTAGQDIYLVDSKNGSETNLKQRGYNFTAQAGIDNTRFSLKYQKTLKVDANIEEDNSIVVYKNNGSLYVKSTGKSINSIQVFDIQGRIISEQKNVNAATATIKNIKANNQVLIVKIADENNKVVAKKVLN